jgi:outer membrane protein TolC
VLDAAWKARAAARQAMLELYAAQQRVKLLDEAVARQEEVLKSLETRIQAGAESRGIAAQPRLLQTQLRLQAADAARAESLARVSLASALGMSAAAIAQAKFSFAAFDRSSGAVRHRYTALTHRADVLAALADYASAEGALRLEVAKQYPDVHLNPGYQLDAGQNKWGVGIGMTLPILNQNRGAIGEAEGRRREMAAKFNAVQAKALNEVDRAAASLAAARAKLAVAEQLFSQQSKQVEMEERRLAAGDEDRLALLNARVERATILLGRLDAQVEVQAALGALEAATQTEVDK